VVCWEWREREKGREKTTFQATLRPLVEAFNARHMASSNKRLKKEYIA